jgi:hypothetical protein
MINERFRGNVHIAIACFNGVFYERLTADFDEMVDRLQREKKSSWNGYHVSIRYDWVNTDAERIVAEAIDKLNRGEDVELSGLLSR